METIKGIIHKVKFHKDSYLIAELSDRTTIIKGNMPIVQYNIEHTFEGNWQSHPKYGDSFAFEYYKTEYPKDLNAIRYYLMDNAKWIGYAISIKLVNTYGEETLNICKSDSERIAREIQGITIERANEISEMLINNEKNEEMQIQLKKLFADVQIGKRVVAKIIELYGHGAVAMITKNPYRLVEDIDGIGFLTADKIALKVGYKKDGKERIQAGIYHVLREESNTGHTCLPINLLITKANDLLGLLAIVTKGDNLFTRIIEDFINDNILTVFNGDSTYVYLPSIYRQENHIANRIKSIIGYKEEEGGEKNGELVSGSRTSN